jgi:Zn finger protein HypA/HybF involved in hydrogenase expression
MKEEKKPVAFITKNKSRLKQSNNQVYLNNNDEFEIEIFNPTKDIISADILISGKGIGGSLVLKPGQRAFIERYVLTPNKFKFTTYEVENTIEVKEAISQNGIVEIVFRKQKEVKNPVLIVKSDYITYDKKPYNNNILRSDKSIKAKLGRSFSNSSNTYSGSITTTINNDMSLYSSNIPTLDFMAQEQTRGIAEISNKIETGIIEKGDFSNQQFTKVDYEFEIIPIETVKMKILPVSAIEVDDIRIYCTECGTRKKKTTFKYCPNCGNKY